MHALKSQPHSYKLAHFFSYWKDFLFFLFVEVEVKGGDFLFLIISEKSEMFM